MTRLPVGTRVAKCNSTPGDGHRDGDEGVVAAPGNPVVGKMLAAGYRLNPPCDLYCIEWDDLSGIGVLIMGTRIRPV